MSAPTRLILTNAEFRALHVLLGPDAGLGEAEQDEAAFGLESLVRRDLAGVDVDGGNAQVPPEVAELFDILVAPSLMVTASVNAVDDEDEGSERHWSATPAVAIEDRNLDDEFHELVPFPAGELFARVVEFLRLPADTGGESVTVTLSPDEFAQLLEAAVARDFAALGEPLAGSGAPLVAVLLERSAIGALSCTLREGPDRLTGGELLWIDGGRHGLWLVEAAEQVVVRRVTVGSSWTSCSRSSPATDPQEPDATCRRMALPSCTRKPRPGTGIHEISRGSRGRLRISPSWSMSGVSSRPLPGLRASASQPV